MGPDQIPLPHGAMLIHDESGQSSDLLVPDFPVLRPEAQHGLAGEFLEFASASSEASAPAILITLLTAVGAMFGRDCFLSVGASIHHPRLFSLIIGSSSRARKGGSADPILRLFEEMAKLNSTISPLPILPCSISSGEALVSAVRDASTDVDKNGTPLDAGIGDKRLLILDSEFGATLRKVRLEGSTISSVLRQAWDGSDLRPLTKRDKISATAPHISLVGHATPEELRANLEGTTEIANGFINRFLLCCARREKVLPLPQPLDSSKLKSFAKRFVTAAESASHRAGLILLSKSTVDLWISIYNEFALRPTTSLDSVICRSEPQILRLALIFTLLDGKRKIDDSALLAARAIVNYSECSARYIFGRASNFRDAERSRRIIDALRSGPKNATSISRLFSGNLSGQELKNLLTVMQDSGIIVQKEVRPSTGRPAKLWHLSAGFVDHIG